MIRREGGAGKGIRVWGEGSYYHRCQEEDRRGQGQISLGFGARSWRTRLIPSSLASKWSCTKRAAYSRFPACLAFIHVTASVFPVSCILPLGADSYPDLTGPKARTTRDSFVNKKKAHIHSFGKFYKNTWKGEHISQLLLDMEARRLSFINPPRLIR